VFPSERDALYARKGIVGRIGPIVVHVGIVIILMGEFGSHDWLLGQEMVPSGQSSKTLWTLDLHTDSQRLVLAGQSLLD